MDQTTIKIALAGLLHDVGKFAERAVMELPTGYYNDNAGLYQPFKRDQNRHTHKHALYTAAFMERYNSLLPDIEDADAARSGNSLINLAAMHHKPETPLQWIVTQADRLSSGMDRQVFEGCSEEVDFKEFRKTRLIPLAEEFLREEKFYKDDTISDYKFRYKLAEQNAANLFPLLESAAKPIDDKSAKAEYAALFEQFVDGLKELANIDLPALWLEHFCSLWERFTTFIPAATVGKVIPDVSLYDHSRATAAISTALYRYHLATNSLNEAALKDPHAKKFMLITGDFSGIQNFIFSAGNSTNRAAAKLLRGRSFVVSMLTELAAYHLCNKLNLPGTSILLDAAGKFTLIAPNLPESLDAVTATEQELNSWLLKHYYGQVGISLSAVTAAPSEFEADNFVNLWERLAKATEAKKYRKLPLAALGVQTNYLDSFDNSLGICPFCGKRAADQATVGELYLGDNEAACLICRDQIRIGAALVKSDSLAILAPNADFPGNRLKEPLFGQYQLAFDLKQDVAATLANKGQLLRHFALLRPAAKTKTGLATKVVSGYVPTYNQADAHDPRLQDDDSFETGDAKTFNHIACTAKNPDTRQGVKALGVLKADVDNLGKIFACGLPEGRYNLSRLATFSRQLNNFFSLYLPDLLASDIRFQNIYTVFAGGDDLFLIGPWNRIITFAEELQKRFNQFACNNNAITVSVGISINKPGIPVPTLADQSEQALTGQAKKQGRNRLSLFGETVTWPEFRQLQQIKDKLDTWQVEGIVGKALLYQMNEFTHLAGMEKQLKSAKRPINLEDMSCLGWRARLTYSATRNIGKGLDRGSRQKAVDVVLQELPLWLTDFDSKFKIALWQVLYNQR